MLSSHEAESERRPVEVLDAAVLLLRARLGRSQQSRPAVFGVRTPPKVVAARQ